MKTVTLLALVVDFLVTGRVKDHYELPFGYWELNPQDLMCSARAITTDQIPSRGSKKIFFGGVIEL